MHYYVDKLRQNVGLETWQWRQIVKSQAAQTKYKWPPYDPYPKRPHENFLRTPLLGAGLRNPEILKNQTNEYKFAAGRKSLFCSSLKKIPEQQLNVRSWATFSAIDKDLANRKKCFHKPYALREPYVE